MKALLAVVAVCLSFAVASAIKATDPGLFFSNDERLGHFAKEPYVDLYKAYAVAFVMPHFPGREPEDPRNYLPSGDECMTFLEKFYNQGKKLHNLDELVVLDACLGYIFESENRDHDKSVSDRVATNLEVFQQDSDLQRIYQTTTINSYSEDAQVCIGTLLLDVIRVKYQFSDVACDNHWIKVFTNFGACIHALPEEDQLTQEKREADSYLQILFELLKTRGLECFHYEIHAMNMAVRGHYLNSPFKNMARSLGPFASKQDQHYWPDSLKEILRAIQGPQTTKINLREVSNILRGTAIGQINFTKKFLKNMSVYADAKIKPKENSKSHAADPTGIDRYTNLVNQICLLFRSTTKKNYYNYAQALIRLVNMLKYPEIFEITTKYFVTKILNKSWDSGAVYLSTSACNILTFTSGVLSTPLPSSELHYNVSFKPNTSGMILWPDAGYY